MASLATDVPLFKYYLSIRSISIRLVFVLSRRVAFADIINSALKSTRYTTRVQIETKPVFRIMNASTCLNQLDLLSVNRFQPAEIKRFNQCLFSIVPPLVRFSVYRICHLVPTYNCQVMLALGARCEPNRVPGICGVFVLFCFHVYQPLEPERYVELDRLLVRRVLEILAVNSDHMDQVLPGYPGRSEKPGGCWVGPGIGDE